jgi:nucleoid-associated protein YgaU
MQGLAAAAGQASRWQAIAEGNGIENPRRLAPGQLIDMNVTLPAL